MLKTFLRAFVLSSTVVAFGCTTAPDGSKTINAPTVGQIAQDVSLVAGGLQKAMAALPGAGVTISADNLMIAQNALAGLQVAATAVASASSPAAAQPLVPQIEGYVNSFVGALGPALATCTSSTCKTISAYIAAANILLPVIEVAVNMAVPQPTSAQADQARAALATPAK